MSPGSPIVLVVHDDVHAAERLLEQLCTVGSVKATVCSDSQEALLSICRTRPDLIIVSTAMPGVDGYRFCRLLKLPLCPGSDSIPVILISTQTAASPELHLARKVRAFALLPHSCDEDTLLRTVQSALTNEPSTSSLANGYQCAGCALIVMPGTATIARALAKQGWMTHSVSTVADAREILTHTPCQAVLLDDAVESAPHLVAWIRSQCPQTVVVVSVDPADSSSAIATTAQGAHDILPRGFAPAAAGPFLADAINRENFRRIQQQSHEQIEQLRAVNDYLDMVIRYSHEAIFSCDLMGRVRIWNRGAEKMYGFTADEIVGCIADDFLDPPEFTRKSPDVIRILRQRAGSFTEGEVLRRKKSGEVFPVHATYSAILNSDGEYIGFSVIERDVATHKALEAEKIKSARLRAITQTAVTANDQINTPLGVILGYAQFLQRKMENIAPEDAAALEIIQQQVLKIKGIMNKLKLMSDPIVKNYSIEGVTMLDLSQSR